MPLPVTTTHTEIEYDDTRTLPSKVQHTVNLLLASHYRPVTVTQRLAGLDATLYRVTGSSRQVTMTAEWLVKHDGGRGRWVYGARMGTYTPGLRLHSFKEFANELACW